MIGTLYHKSLFSQPTQYDTIVIGSGIGGLCTAACLAKQGQRVLVLEQHYTAGGFTHSFRRAGFEWDVGVHYIGDVHRPNSFLKKIFDHISNGQLAWHKMDAVYDRLVFPDHTFDFEAPKQKLRDNLVQQFPNEEQAIDQHFELVKTVLKSTKSYYLQKVMPQWLTSLMTPFLGGKEFKKLAARNTYEVLKEITNNEKLIAVLTGQYGDYGLSPQKSSFVMHASVFSHYLDGGNYPIGGSKMIAHSILPQIEKAGGKVVVRAEVEKVLVQNNLATGVQLKSGEQIFAKHIVSDAGAYNTFFKLLPDLPVLAPIKQHLGKINRSSAHFCLYIGAQHNDQTRQIRNSNLWVYPSYDHDQSVHKFETDPNAPFPVVYISFPSLKDPHWQKSHSDKMTVEVVVPAPFDLFEKWQETQWQKRGSEYEQFKQQMTDRLLNILYQQVPALKGQVVFSELSTPLSTKHFCKYDQGEIYGLEHTPERFAQKWNKPKTPIKNFYLTGQDIATDGVAGALVAGVLSATVISGKNLFMEIGR